jgi:choloylglycine hydrolase
MTVAPGRIRVVPRRAAMCTSFKLSDQDGTTVIGRTMEFGLPVNWDLHVVPRGTKQHAMAPDGPGASWTAKYGYVGMAPGHTVLGPIDSPAHDGVADGVNEAGLWVGLLYLPSFAEYQDPTGVPSDQLMGPLDVANYLLGTCGTCEEAIAAMEKVTVWAEPLQGLGVQPLHAVLHDKAGGSSVIEYTADGRRVHDVPLGVVTNSPPFPWHEINLRNYVNLTAKDVPDVTVDDTTFQPMGAGSGMIGLPGDFTPPSRFIRATALSAAAYPPKDASDGVHTALHILGSFDIPKGSVRTEAPDGIPADVAKKMGLGDFTNWSVVAELGDAPAYTIKTYDEPSPRRLVLTEELLGGDAVTVKSVMGAGEIRAWEV